MKYQVGDVVLGDGEPFRVKAIGDKYAIISRMSWKWKFDRRRFGVPKVTGTDQRSPVRESDEEMAVALDKLDSHQCMWVSPHCHSGAYLTSDGTRVWWPSKKVVLV